jgi:hypothetical protein
MMAVGAAAALLGPTVAEAQCGGGARCRDPEAAAPVPAAPMQWRGELQVAGVNAAIGGVTAGVVARARGGSFVRAFARGFAGGTGVYAGTRLATARFASAGFLGREVAAVGASVVRNAADGRGSFDRLVIPLGIGRLDVDRTIPGATRFGLDLPAIATAVYAATRPELRFDAAASASAGLPVFVARHGFQGDNWEGRHMAGVIWLRENIAGEAGGTVHSRVLAHETIHAIQNDFAFIAWSRPVEQRMPRRMLGPVSRFVDLNLQVPALGAASLFTGYDERPWEREAHFLAGTGK